MVIAYPPRQEEGRIMAHVRRLSKIESHNEEGCISHTDHRRLPRNVQEGRLAIGNGHQGCVSSRANGKAQPANDSVRHTRRTIRMEANAIRPHQRTGDVPTIRRRVIARICRQDLRRILRRRTRVHRRDIGTTYSRYQNGINTIRTIGIGSEY